ncbi:Pentatricopeptide repeat-containing protein At2g38420, mitochondrial [Linum perenne]
MAGIRSSSLKTSSIFLRKHRKWPHSPYKTQWHLSFNQVLAMQSLKQAAKSPQTLLSSLIQSFTIYDCNPTPQAYHFVLTTMAKTSQLHHIPPVLDHLEKIEQFETPELILADLIRLYCESDEIETAVAVFFRIPKFRCAPTAVSLNTLLTFLCRTNSGLKMVPEILLKSRDLNIRVEESSFRILITALCRVKRVSHAIEIFHRMIDDGFVVGPEICSFLLSSLCEQSDVSSSDVIGFSVELRKLGFSPGLIDYTNLIRFLVREGYGMEAANVLNQMKSDGIKPDIVCYNLVLKGAISIQDFELADKVFDELLLYGLVPDIRTYNIYIDGLCKQGKTGDGMKMVESIQQLGCKPDVTTYNTLMAGVSKAGDLSGARELVKEMGKKGIRRNPQTYGIMISLLASCGEMAEACGLMNEALKGNFDPGAGAWEAILCGFGSKLECSETGIVELIR